MSRLEKGNTAGKGRPKGSKNKQTERIRQFFADFMDKHIDELDDAFSELEAKDKFKFLIDMAKFVIPSLKSIELGNILDTLSDKDFEKLLSRLKEDYNLK